MSELERNGSPDPDAAGEADGARGSLATERDIDPAFGMFEDGLGQGTTGAAERLRAMYPTGAALGIGDDEEAFGDASVADDADDADMSALSSEAEPGEFPDVPDADAISANSPVDPASPPDQFHGTDLLNGVGLFPEEEDPDSLL